MSIVLVATLLLDVCIPLECALYTLCFRSNGLTHLVLFTDTLKLGAAEIPIHLPFASNVNKMEMGEIASCGSGNLTSVVFTNVVLMSDPLSVNVTKKNS